MFLSEPMWNINMSTFEYYSSLDVMQSSLLLILLQPVWWGVHQEVQMDPSIYIQVALWQNVTDPFLSWPGNPDYQTKTSHFWNFLWLYKTGSQHDDEDFAWQYQGTDVLMYVISERPEKKSYFLILNSCLFVRGKIYL